MAFSVVGAQSAAVAAPANDVGRVVRVVDGDTVIVESGGAENRIRITGINTMELTNYEKGQRAGECRARQATRRMEELVLNKTVRLTALDAASKSGERLRRTIEVLGNDGKVRYDPAKNLLREGLALWMPNKFEFTPNQEYAALAAEAAAKRIGIWNPDGCGAGPSSSAVLRIAVQWRGDESVTIENRWIAPTDLGGWWLRDSSFLGERARGYQFPPGTVLPANSSIVLHTGKGKDRANQYYWGLDNDSVFNNVTGTPGFMADGAYLFDPDGDIRAALQYAPGARIQIP